jgi:hypothetical protein
MAPNGENSGGGLGFDRNSMTLQSLWVALGPMPFGNDMGDGD